MPTSNPEMETSCTLFGPLSAMNPALMPMFPLPRIVTSLMRLWLLPMYRMPSVVGLSPTSRVTCRTLRKNQLADVLPSSVGCVRRSDFTPFSLSSSFSTTPSRDWPYSHTPRPEPVFPFCITSVSVRR